MVIDAFLSEDGAWAAPLAKEWLRVTGQQLDQAVTDLQLTPGAHGMMVLYSVARWNCAMTVREIALC